MVGILPWTYLLVQAGATIEEVQSLGVTNPKTVLSLFVLGAIALLPTLLIKEEAPSPKPSPKKRQVKLSPRKTSPRKSPQRQKKQQ